MNHPVIDAVRKVADDAKKQYVGMDEVIDVIAMSILSGTHALLVGPAGTGKTSIIKFFCKSLGLSFGKVLMNGDVTRSDIFGPTDPVSLQNGNWTRIKSGLSTSNIFFVDEAGRGNAQTTNLLLEAMEERTYTGEGKTVDLDLHVVFGATNSLFSRDQAAFFDRWTWRVLVSQWGSGKELMSALTNSVLIQPNNSFSFTYGDFQIISDLCLLLSKNASNSVKQSIVSLWSESKGKLIQPISNRNWLRLLQMAAAHALYYGKDAIEPDDLKVIIYLWSVPDEINTLSEIIKTSLKNEEEDNFNDISDKISKIYKMISDNKMTLSDQTQCMGQLMIIERKIRSLGYTGKKWDGIKKEIIELKEILVNYDADGGK